MQNNSFSVYIAKSVRLFKRRISLCSIIVITSVSYAYVIDNYKLRSRINIIGIDNFNGKFDLFVNAAYAIFFYFENSLSNVTTILKVCPIAAAPKLILLSAS